LTLSAALFAPVLAEKSPKIGCITEKRALRAFGRSAKPLTKASINA
jgi:hypothetical protein